jgi:hypothetical protein
LFAWVKPLWIPKHIGEDNIKTAVWSDVDWIHSAQSGNQWRAIGNMVMNQWRAFGNMVMNQWRAIGNMAMNIQVPQLAGNFFLCLRKCLLAS